MLVYSSNQQYYDWKEEGNIASNLKALLFNHSYQEMLKTENI